ncbi:MAG TPA: hypothetical protein VIK86_09865 [Candidatus Paceibacterota bacterium]
MNKFYVLLIIVALGFGGYWYINNQSKTKDFIQSTVETKNSIINKTTSEIDGLIKNAVSGVNTISPLYYLQNRNYGISATENICVNTKSKGSIGGIISEIQKLTNRVTCTVDSNFPSKSFTLVAPSLIDKNVSYCTDQSGFSVINTASVNTFKAGFKCK